jgi:hypothetical protein
MTEGRYERAAQRIARADGALLAAISAWAPWTGRYSCQLAKIENDIRAATAKHNVFLKELGLALLPLAKSDSRKN